MANTNEKNQVLWTIANFKGGDIKFIVDDLIVVDYINEEIGKSITITNPKLVFMENKIVTDPNLLKKVVINATVIKQHRGPKVIVFKSRRRKNSCRKKGHRQDLTTIKIDSITM
jgi:large subunit ribosomal protein L21